MNKVLVNARMLLDYDEQTDRTFICFTGNGKFSLSFPPGAVIDSLAAFYWDKHGKRRLLAEANLVLAPAMFDTTGISLPLVFTTMSHVDTKGVLSGIGLDSTTKGKYTYFTFYHEGRRTIQVRINGNYMATPRTFSLTQYPI